MVGFFPCGAILPAAPAAPLPWEPAWGFVCFFCLSSPSFRVGGAAHTCPRVKGRSERLPWLWTRPHAGERDSSDGLSALGCFRSPPPSGLAPSIPLKLRCGASCVLSPDAGFRCAERGVLLGRDDAHLLSPRPPLGTAPSQCVPSMSHFTFFVPLQVWELIGQGGLRRLGSGVSAGR